MKPFRYIAAISLAGVLMAGGCKKIEDLQQNPAAIYDPNAQLIFTGLLLNIDQGPWGTDQRNNQYMVINESYYGNQSYAWGTGSTARYDQLRNVVQLEEQAIKMGDNGKPYLALAKFFKAYSFIEMTTMLGEIPLKDAMKGRTEGIFQPAYDAQKDIYQQCLQWLDEANADISTLLTQEVTGDFYYNGKLDKWQKLINSYRLRVLISLSRRAADEPSLKVREQFAEIVNNPAKYPLILSNTDNLQLVYNSTTTSNYYPLWPSNGVVVKQDLRNNLGHTYVSILTATSDPRLFVVANPTDSAKNSGDPQYATKFTSFRGGRSGELQTTLKSQAVAGKLSTINFDYWMASPAGVPNILLGAAEVEFTIAEAINRGWITGDAADHFNKGIRASMKFYNISDAAINVYFAIPGNAYAGNNAQGLEQILKQKYVAFFQNSGREAYYNFRRTGVPVFDIGPGNGNNNQIPVRWAYPTVEYTTNEANLKASLQRQFSGADTRNNVMWLIK